MATLIEIGHVVGTLIALVAFGLGILMLTRWEIERNRKSYLQEMSLDLGIPVGELDNDEN
jgi:hypothetical protein